MARENRRDKRTPGANDNDLPVYGDFSYDDTLEAITADLPEEPPEEPIGQIGGEEAGDNASDTPEEALAKFRREKGYGETEAEQEAKRTPRQLRRDDVNDGKDGAGETTSGKKRKRNKSKGLFGWKKKEAEEQDDQRTAPSRRGGWKRTISLILITTVLVVVMLSIGVSYFVSQDGMLNKLLTMPQTAVSSAVSPVQEGFSWITQSVVNYFRRIKLRSRLEEEYEALRAENERLTYEAMRADELQRQLAQYEDINDEINANRNMDPVTAAVTSRYDGNYFSTFTINKGKQDGIEEFMAVTISGSLIGYTETVRDTESTVRTIIDSEASVAGLIQTSRDQGIISGTLGVDGTALCRMYYLPEDNLPRPGDLVVTSGVGMSFPKGIPIGTVRESTRGMDANKQYVVVEPSADFEHIEYVIVYRYKPQPEAIQNRDNASSYLEFVPLDTPRPYPTIAIGASINFLPTATPDGTPEPTQEPTPSPTAAPTPTPEPIPTPAFTGEVYSYTVVDHGPTATPTAEPTPTPTPHVTVGPNDLDWEED